MANGFGSLYIGAAGLRSAQNALNTTANNLSNVDTSGYVRQQVRFADMNYDTIKLSHANVNLQQTGLGVSIGDVVHARDIFLDKTYRQENGRREFYSVRYETATYVEDMMQELDGEEFKQSVEDLWQAFQELSTNPADSVTQNLVLQKSDLFVTRSSALYSNLKSYQSNINMQIKDDVDRVNEIGERIYELNLQIQKVEAGGVETAMTLRDERDSLLDELSSYGNIDYVEDCTSFVFVDFEGTNFIDENKCYEMGLLKDYSTGFYTPYWPHLSDENKQQYVNVFRHLDGFDTETNTDIGGLKSKLMVRGDIYGRAENLEAKPEDPNQRDPDQEYYEDIQYCTLVKVEAELDQLFSTIVKDMNDIYCPNTSSGVEEGKTLVGWDTDGNQVKITSTTKILDVDNCIVGADGKLPPRELFVRSGCDRYTEVKVTGADGSEKTYYVYNEEDPEDASKRYEIGNVRVNEELEKQITLMPAYKNDGVYDQVAYDYGAKFAAAWENQGMTFSPYDAKPCTYEEYYNKIVEEVGIEGDVYQAATETLEGSVTSIDNKRLMVTGVSSDEELTQMIKYQSAYNAASRFMTVISEMTELIVTGLI